MQAIKAEEANKIQFFLAEGVEIDQMFKISRAKKL